MALDQLPKTAGEWPDAMAAQAKKYPGDMTRSLPLVKFDEAEFSARFSPEAAGSAKRTLEAADSLVTGADAGTKVLDVGALAAKSTAIRKGFDSYKQAYIAYWRDSVKDEVKFSFADFAALSRDLVRVTDAGVKSALEKYQQKMVEALNAIGATVEAGALEKSPALVSKECSLALNSWSTLEPAVARQQILAMDPRDFLQTYTVASSKESQTLAGRYWQAFAAGSAAGAGQ